ncbi:MAG TPA: hypothetical protein VI750_09015 [Pyrinomonadaceae bacterium]|nr:hypothetical protein [Pyrinomonadaceae bacterium]
MFMLLFPSVLSSQSIADAARANRLKKVKITTQRVFTNDDVKHRDSNQEAGVPTDVSKLAAPRQSSTVDEGVLEAERAINILVGKTPAQLGFQCFGYRQFWSDQHLWEQNLYGANQKLVDATRVWISMMRSGAVRGIAHDQALANMEVARIAYNETQERCIVAVHAWDKLEAWKAAHVGDWYLPSKANSR